MPSQALHFKFESAHIHAMSSRDVSLRAWQSLTAEEQAQVRALRVDDQQLEYAGTVERAIETCTFSLPSEAAWLAIMLGEAVAGFLVLRRGTKLPEWAPQGSVALAGMRIDRAFQGVGLGSRSLRAVDVWLSSNWPEVTTLALCVDAENLAGRAAYRNAGFLEFMELRLGRIGTVHFLAKQLPSGSSAAQPLAQADPLPLATLLRRPRCLRCCSAQPPATRCYSWRSSAEDSFIVLETTRDNLTKTPDRSPRLSSHGWQPQSCQRSLSRHRAPSQLCLLPCWPSLERKASHEHRIPRLSP